MHILEMRKNLLSLSVHTVFALFICNVMGIAFTVVSINEEMDSYLGLEVLHPNFWGEVCEKSGTGPCPKPQKTWMWNGGPYIRIL